MEQEGRLVVLIRKVSSETKLKSNQYFVLVHGKRAVRFGDSEEELVLYVDKDDCKSPTSIYVFQRDKAQNGSLGRKRKLLDSCSVSILRSEASKSSERVLEWKGNKFAFHSIGVSVVVDVEFYLSKPLLPGKMLRIQERPSPTLIPKVHVESESKKVSSRVRNENYQEQAPTDANSKSSTRLHFFPRYRRKHKKSKQQDQNVIYYGDDDLILYQNQNSMELSKNENSYEHGDSTINLKDVTKIDPNTDIYTFIKKNQHKPALNDILELHATPQEHFNKIRNNGARSHSTEFLHRLPAGNVKMTGYIGCGKWVKSRLPEEAIRYYLMPFVKSLPSPPLPPKCPVDMLWDEFYLISKTTTSKTAQVN